MLKSNFNRVFDIISTGLVSLDEAKTHLQVYNDDFDAQINRLITAAVNQANNYIGEFLTEATVDAYYNGFNPQLLLPNRFILLIMSVSYYNTDNELTVLDPSNYIYDNTTDVPSVRMIGEMPALSQIYSNPVIIRYISIIPEENLNEAAKQAVLLYISEMFNYSSSFVIDGNPSRLPLTSERLLSNFKSRWI